jgi:CHAT domain-containing protein
MKLILETNPHTDKTMFKIGKKYYAVAEVKQLNRGYQRDDVQAVLKEISKEKYDALLNEVAKKLEKHVDIKKLLLHKLRHVPLKNINEMNKTLDKRKPKIQTKDGCVYLKIGRNDLELFD